MQDRPHAAPIDYERLGKYLRALSVPTRIQLLHKLQVPQTASEVRLPAFRQDADKNPDRPISRQAVEGHLKKLEEIGLVGWRPVERGGQQAKQYHIDHPRLFVVADEMRRLSLIRPAMDVVSDVTRIAHDEDASVHRRHMPEGPTLVLVSGPREGTAFALDGDGPWGIGRGGDNAVAVDHDPFVSTRNAEIFQDDGWFLRDLAGSRNGTMHNWNQLEEGGTVPLAAGDTVGVGRSMLVMRGI